MAKDNTVMVQASVRRINEQNEKNAQYRVDGIVQDIIVEQKVIVDATKRISDLQVKLKEVSYDEIAPETVL